MFRYNCISEKSVQPISQPHRRVPFSFKRKSWKITWSCCHKKVDEPTDWLSPIAVGPKKRRVKLDSVDMGQPNKAIKCVILAVCQPVLSYFIPWGYGSQQDSPAICEDIHYCLNGCHRFLKTWFELCLSSTWNIASCRNYFFWPSWPLLQPWKSAGGGRNTWNHPTMFKCFVLDRNCWL